MRRAAGRPGHFEQIEPVFGPGGAARQGPEQLGAVAGDLCGRPCGHRRGTGYLEDVLTGASLEQPSVRDNLAGLGAGPEQVKAIQGWLPRSTRDALKTGSARTRRVPETQARHG